MRVFLLVALTSCLASVYGWQSCDDPLNPLVIASTTAQMSIGKVNASFCAKNQTTGIADCSTWISYQLNTLQERSNPTMPAICWDYPLIQPGDNVNVLSEVFMSDMTCQAEVVDEILAPGVSKKTVVLWYSLSTMPNLTIHLNYSVANASFDLNLGSSNYSEGRDMIISYRYAIASSSSHFCII